MFYYCYLKATNEDSHYVFDFTTTTKEDCDSFRLNPEFQNALNVLYQPWIQRYFDSSVYETLDPIPKVSEVEASDHSHFVSSFEGKSVYY